MNQLKKHSFWAIALCFLATSFTVKAQSGLFVYGNYMQIKSQRFKNLTMPVLNSGNNVKTRMEDPARQFGYGAGYRVDIANGFGFWDIGYDYATSESTLVLKNEATYRYKLSQGIGLTIIGIKIGAKKAFFIAPSGGFWAGTQKQNSTATEGTSPIQYAPQPINIKADFNMGIAFALAFGTNAKRINLFGKGIYYMKGMMSEGVGGANMLDYKALGLHAGVLISLGGSLR